MDQDAFRQLLANSHQSQPNGKQAVSCIANLKPLHTATSTPGPVFKPRKVKKTEGRYRDRAAERREGIGNDYADVEAVLEDFENRVANVDRDGIGGDSQHTVLVKGLDMSLLEQNRTRAAPVAEDDEILEEAFAEATSIPEHTEPKKRAREDIIRDLKAKRQNGDSAVSGKSAEGALEKTKMAGKFRPIGFKPIGQTEEKVKKRRGGGGKGSVKKKKKLEVDITPVPDAPEPSGTNNTKTESRERDITGPSFSKMPQKSPEPELVPLDEDFDIFAGAGDYEGFPDDEESEERSNTEELRVVSETVSPVPVVGAIGWFGEPEPDVRQASAPPEKPSPVPETEEEPQQVRLKPLESSALPSIRDFLAMDEAVEKAEKRRARKEKKKKKKAGDDDD